MKEKHDKYLKLQCKFVNEKSVLIISKKQNLPPCKKCDDAPQITLLSSLPGNLCLLYHSPWLLLAFYLLPTLQMLPSHYYYHSYLSELIILEFCQNVQLQH